MVTWPLPLCAERVLTDIDGPLCTVGQGGTRLMRSGDAVCSGALGQVGLCGRSPTLCGFCDLRAGPVHKQRPRCAAPPLCPRLQSAVSAPSWTALKCPSAFCPWTLSVKSCRW